MDEVVGAVDDARPSHRDRWIGVYIGVLAVVLAIAAMGGDNAAKTATIKNIEASNTWAFFQAKNLRRQIVRTQIENLELTLLASPGLDDASKAQLMARMAEHKASDSKLTTDPTSGEGLDELFVKGKALEQERDRAMAQDPYFDYGQALLQIAIVLASIAIISGGNALLGLSGVLGFAGALLTINGFTLAVSIPGLS
ncbi:DUF4337 domain-containing protein [Filomicrobium sp.]|uniref:DUF4337 domain-containing protein n=1 Tax=Filomicrobium sp. TaxID=2024831 RepID=UPI002588E99E|nr:DUF4337 domain-containing protein [Filomicrobium sp.]MCV0370631.1 DUF4337 domain-containing protein [Filomicrobium sp.]